MALRQCLPQFRHRWIGNGLRQMGRLGDATNTSKSGIKVVGGTFDVGGALGLVGGDIPLNRVELPFSDQIEHSHIGCHGMNNRVGIGLIKNQGLHGRQCVRRRRARLPG